MKTIKKLWIIPLIAVILLFSSCGSASSSQAGSTTVQEVSNLFRRYESAYATGIANEFVAVCPQQLALLWDARQEGSSFADLVGKTILIFKNITGSLQYTVTDVIEFEDYHNQTSFSALLSAKSTVLRSAASETDSPFPCLGNKMWAVFLSNSMSPAFSAGDIILCTRPEDTSLLKIGDVITFKSGDLDGDGQFDYCTHRIVQIQYENGHPAFVTKGDNSTIADTNLVHEEDIVGVWTGEKAEEIGKLYTYVFSQTGQIDAVLNNSDSYEKVAIAKVNVECNGNTYPCEFVVMKTNGEWKIANPFWFMKMYCPA